jgi:hypothetical protein
VNPTKPDSHASGLKTLTDWYPADVKPVRAGVYETIAPNRPPGQLGWYSYWNGKVWGIAYGHRYLAWSVYAEPSKFQDRQWRGLTEQSK